MNIPQKQVSLTVRLGKCRRGTEIKGKHPRRTISWDCRIIFSDFKEEGQARGDEVKVSIQEIDTEKEVMGRFDTIDMISLGLPPAPFAELWAACAAADGTARDLTIQFRSDEAELCGNTMPVWL
jgi:hypothetical protein